MTNERAIKLLHRLQDEQFDGIHGDERRKALEMAVRALVEPNIGQKTIGCIIKRLNGEDTAQPTQTNADSTQSNTLDCVSRRMAIDTEGLDEQIRCEMCRNPIHTDRGCDGNCKYDEKLYERIIQILSERITPLSSAQPERTCVNCGRTANNGGWYADGGTRCPIEEHYALPKDGYCHLWEKRNVTDDDYPERRTDE